MSDYEVEVLEFIEYCCTQFFNNGLELPLDMDIRLIEAGIDPVYLEEIYINDFKKMRS